jgi:hypothetical protein
MIHGSYDDLHGQLSQNTLRTVSRIHVLLVEVHDLGTIIRTGRKEESRMAAITERNGRYVSIEINNMEDVKSFLDKKYKVKQ